MDQSLIFRPFFATMLLTFVVWVVMYTHRIRFILRNKITPEDLAIPGKLASLTPPSVSNPSDNLKNLFEMPVIFYATMLYLFVTHHVDPTHVGAAWAFVGLRTLHSAVHCTFNLVHLRFYLYLFSCVALGVMVIRAALVAFGM